MSAGITALFPGVPVSEIAARIGFKTVSGPTPVPSNKDLARFSMNEDDSKVLRYLFRNFRPSRHLEFGTWQGKGVLCCLEECDATVWTVNLLEGENDEKGGWAYSSIVGDLKRALKWVRTQKFADPKGAPVVYHQTDARGMIGRYYLEAGMGHRVCQIYADSREWDISRYPEGFFDTALIDGGHQEEIVLNDTRKALRLVRSGGLVLWHDFCPKESVRLKKASVRGVVSAVEKNLEEIQADVLDLFWIEPSHLLVGIRK